MAIAKVKRDHFSFQSVARCGRFHQILFHLFRIFGSRNVFCDVFDAMDKPGKEIGIHQLFRSGHGPKPVL